MTNLAAMYKIPQEIQRFVDDGFLEVLSENDAEKTVEFHISSKRSTDRQGRTTTFTLTWIHPDFNAQFCHFYDQTPGDGPNFYVQCETADLGDELIELDSVEHLESWLEEFQKEEVS